MAEVKCAQQILAGKPEHCSRHTGVDGKVILILMLRRNVMKEQDSINPAQDMLHWLETIMAFWV
jgi:hypothetical protein